MGLGWLSGLFILITVSVFSVLVKLGFWQLDRAEFKTQWQQTIHNRETLPAMDYDELVDLLIQSQSTSTDIPTQLLTGYKVAVNVSPVSNQIYLLDNQVYQGQVGYLAYQIFKHNDASPYLLVELGFIAANKDRQVLPVVDALPNKEYQLTGRIYQKQANPLSEHLYAEPGNPMRFQNLAIDELASTESLSLLNVVLQPNNLPNLHYPQPWQPIPLSAQKHQGYALQWFTMAAVFLGLMGWLAMKYWRANS
ncbi:SURF1 family protein [Shewanella gaetbuli]